MVNLKLKRKETIIMQKESKTDILKQSGDLLGEVCEAKKLSKASDDEIITLTVECSAFFTLVCC
jgi:hypothetical protein